MDLLSGGGAVKMEDKSSIGGCLPPWESIIEASKED